MRFEYKNQVPLSEMKRPFCLTIVKALSTNQEGLAARDAEAISILNKLNGADIRFAATSQGTEIAIYLEPNDIERAREAHVRADMLPCRVFVKDGTVRRAERWTRCSGLPWPVVRIERKGDGFRSDVGSPEYGDLRLEGTLDETLQNLQPEEQKPFRNLFNLHDSVPEKIEEMILGQQGFEESLVLFEQ